MADYSGKRIYIAEDNLFSYEYLYEVLKHSNAEIKHANNGVELLELISDTLPDIVLLDIQMPEMDGKEAVVEIRKRYGSSLPVIAQTAHTLDQELLLYLSLGCNAAITKPINRKKLFEVIDEYM